MIRPGHARLLGYALPVVAVITLTLLFIVALARLAEIQQDMRNNVSANMLWVITQTQAESLVLSAQLHGAAAGKPRPQELIRQFDLLHSRLRLLSAGPQRRYLDDYKLWPLLSEPSEQALQLGPLIKQIAAGQVAPAVALAVLDPLNSLLRQVASRTMIAQWEELGGRMDRYRDAVLVIIFLMIGIVICSLIISVRMFLALRRDRQAREMKRHAAQLEVELDSERKINELYRSFGAMVSHQFRTPLAIIDASMQRLLRMGNKVEPDEVARRVGKVRKATQRLTRLIDNTLIADQYVDMVNVRLEACDLGLLVREVCESQLTIAPNSPLNIDIQSAMRVSCDPSLVEHILFNFLSNAVKYSAPEATVHVRVFQDGDWLCCSVSDQGMGVDQDQLDQVFERYFRSSKVATIQGTGIGLYVARKLALMQGGQVTAASTEGRGSVFTLCLPAASTHSTESL
ncbi:MAG: HAMP domain-containing histidine kinase [Burkholderiaceae bacterium]|nr:HAMP domain-containing histidine kinase [Burkholderiaceae bacterium]